MKTNPINRKDRAKFKGSLRKWDDARYPLLMTLFIEILSLAKGHSQREDVDIVTVVASFEK